VSTRVLREFLLLLHSPTVLEWTGPVHHQKTISLNANPKPRFIELNLKIMVGQRL